jgi:pyruvate dehydrogenase E1 component beta subunit
MALLNMPDAIDQATREEMRRDESVIVMGTMPVASPLMEEFGTERVRVTPIAENATVGMAVGAAGSGLRPVVLLGNMTFSFVAFDQIANQAGRIRFMFGAQREFPLVLRGSYWNGSRAAAQHCQTAYALFGHTGGLKIVAPSSSQEAHGLMKSAIRDDNPVMFHEAYRIWATPQNISDDDETAVIPFGRARIARHGSDVTIVAIAYMVTVAMEAAEKLAAEGISAEVIDPRTLVPMDLDTIRASVARTGRLVVVDESFPTCSMASEIIAATVEEPSVHAALQGPPRRVTTQAMPMPFSRVLEDFNLPSADKIVDAVRVTLG